MAWLSILLVLAVLGLVSLFAFRRLVRQGQQSQFDADWLNEFSAAKYRPMTRLLAVDDYEFLALQKGGTKQLARELRAERRRIFRAYLRNLVTDFERLYRSGQVIVTYSAGDKSQLAAALFHQRIHFYRALALVHTRLVLHTMGLARMDVADLLQSLDRIRVSLDDVMAGQAIGATA